MIQGVDMKYTKRQQRALETAKNYQQGNIEGLDDAMTRRLVASTAYTESNGGDLAVINSLGYVGRYQAGAGWLADAGFIDKSKLNQASAGFRSETVWARSGGMTEFLADARNWTGGLTLDKYLASGELQDLAFKRNCDAAYKRAIKNHVLKPSDSLAHVAGFLKARHIAGYGGAVAVVSGGRLRRDDNQTSNYDYYNDIARDRDGLDALVVGIASLGPTPNVVPLGSSHFTSHQRIKPKIEHVGSPTLATVQNELNNLGYQDSRSRPLAIDGTLGPSTTHAIKSFQRAHHLHVDGIVGKQTLAALEDAKRWPLLSEATHPQHRLYAQVEQGIDALPNAHGTAKELNNAAVALTIAAHASGLRQVDHVVLGANGINLFAVQGRMDDPAHRRVHVELAHAMTHALDHRVMSTPAAGHAHGMDIAQQQMAQRGPVMMGP
jgi:hypothetical protein